MDNAGRLPVEDPGDAPSTYTTNGTQFFSFRIRFNRKASAVDIGTPQWGQHPQREILDLPLSAHQLLCIYLTLNQFSQCLQATTTSDQ